MLRSLRAVRLLALLAAAGLAGCSGGARYQQPSTAGLVTTPRYYPPPGPPEDPWGPYINDAATRFSIPARWIRAVMQQESGGQQQAVSPVGAMGLMQLMPPTYAGLRDQYALGDDPFAPHDNILAGAAYLRQMYDRFGAPAFLAAYNAGPERVDDYLSTGDPLPDETINYLVALTPQLGADTTLSGPLAAYAGNAPAEQVAELPPPTPTSLAAGCDPDAAYDPDRPCHALEQAASAPAPAPPVIVAQAPAPQGDWAIQVGAFTSAELARSQAERAASEEPDLLSDATVSLPTTTPFGGKILYRARLVALPQDRAALACQRLNQRQLPCIVVRPDAA